MMPIQYRDPETEEVLDRRYEASAPEIGQSVTIDGFGECRVLYRWRCNPSCCVVYVRSVRQEAHAAA